MLRNSSFIKTGMLTAGTVATGTNNSAGAGAGPGAGPGSVAGAITDGAASGGASLGGAGTGLSNVNEDSLIVAQSSDMLLKWLALAQQVQAGASDLSAPQQSYADAGSREVDVGRLDGRSGGDLLAIGVGVGGLASRPSSSEISERNFQVRPINETTLKILRLWVARAKRNHRYPNLRGTD